MATHSIFLPEESHGGRSLVGGSAQGCRELDMTEATEHNELLGLLLLVLSGDSFSILWFLHFHEPINHSAEDLRGGCSASLQSSLCFCSCLFSSTVFCKFQVHLPGQIPHFINSTQGDHWASYEYFTLHITIQPGNFFHAVIQGSFKTYLICFQSLGDPWFLLPVVQ